MIDDFEILDDKPNWIKNKEKYDHHYRTERTKGVAFRLRIIEDAEYIRIYESIPNKTEFFRKCLRMYKNGEINYGKTKK